MYGGLTRQENALETVGENKSAIIVGIVVACWIVATAVVTLRIYTRKVLLNQIGSDDYFAVASLVSSFPFLLLFDGNGARDTSDPIITLDFTLSIGGRRSAQYVTCSFSLGQFKSTNADQHTVIKYGLGRHIWTISQPDFVTYLKVSCTIILASIRKEHGSHFFYFLVFLDYNTRIHLGHLHDQDDVPLSILQNSWTAPAPLRLHIYCRRRRSLVHGNDPAVLFSVPTSCRFLGQNLTRNQMPT